MFEAAVFIGVSAVSQRYICFHVMCFKHTRTLFPGLMPNDAGGPCFFRFSTTATFDASSSSDGRGGGCVISNDDATSRMR